MVMFSENHFGGLKYCYRKPQVKGDILQARRAAHWYSICPAWVKPDFKSQCVPQKESDMIVVCSGVCL